jgi:hypothetical protein
MFLKIKENIELYENTFDYIQDCYNSDINQILINKSDDGYMARVKLLLNVKKNNILYKDIKEIMLSLGQNFRNYCRDKSISDVIDEKKLEPEGISDNLNIRYLRYKSKLVEYDNQTYFKTLKKHLKISTPVCINNRNGVINDIFENECLVYFHDTKNTEMVKIHCIEIRNNDKKKKVNSELNKLKTKELISLRNETYINNGAAFYNDKEYTKEEIINVLNIREHLEKKPKNKSRRYY